ncbi:MAG TPA: C25 family cysteine peptidase, partial [Chloroflexota bacterium]|nr:C25 family cysteine peptidase [Chloroflexota bacterium]
SIRSSPPIVAGEFDSRWLAARRLLHFSLNGRPGGDAWFGQPSRDVASNDWQLPIALTARGLAGSELAAPVVFSATGYSLDAESENPTRSLSLRFLSEGAAGFVGSASACYGTNLLPVAGADLLGSLFWEQLRSGQPVGAALQSAKRSFAARALEDQGYLDGDDQKTLLQFVLLGDPLLAVFETSWAGGEPPTEVGISSTDLLCNHDGDRRGNGQVDPRTVRAAVEVLALRCPEAVDGAVRIHRRSSCDGLCGQSIHPDDESMTERATGITSVTSRTDLAQPDGSHLIRFARATVGADGRIVKTLVSR